MQLDLQNKPRAQAALALATQHHLGIERNWTGEPYITHPIRVAEKLLSHNYVSEDVIAVALLHDCLEDEDQFGRTMPPGKIEAHCGGVVLRSVRYLTNTEVGNRAQRKRLACQRIAGAPSVVRAIKVADIIDNLTGIADHDPSFARVYLEEKKAMLDALRGNTCVALTGEAYNIYGMELNKLAVYHLNMGREFEAREKAVDDEILAIIEEEERERLRTLYADVALF